MSAKSYLALGDSYTIGESVADSERFPMQLQDSLKNKNIILKDVNIIAKTGWTTDELAKALDTTTVSSGYNLVTLLIGVNNQYRGRNIEDYRNEFSSLLSRAISYADGQTENVIVISIPDWGVTPFASQRNAEKIASEIDDYNQINKTISNDYKVHYVDVTDISRKAKTDTTLVANDGLHPSEKMYALWVEKIIPLASTILKKQK